MPRVFHRGGTLIRENNPKKWPGGKRKTKAEKKWDKIVRRTMLLAKQEVKHD
jgi:hypothetical protein